MTTENILIALLLSVLLVSTAVLAVCIQALQGKLEIRMIPNEEIQAMVRFIKSNPDYSRLMSPQEVEGVTPTVTRTYTEKGKSGGFVPKNPNPTPPPGDE